MKRRISFGVALLACLAWMPVQAQQLPTYDDFSGPHIDPAKWITPPPCAVNVSDCVRAVLQGRLRLAMRGYGATDSESGRTFADSSVFFRNPGAIDTILFTFAVTSIDGAACPPPSTNTEAALSQLLAHGAFFNSGTTGTPDEDVVAYLAVERGTDDLLPGVLRVIGFMSTGPGFFNFVDLGTLLVGEPAFAQLKWDRENHAFVWSVLKTTTTPRLVTQRREYLDQVASDTAPPVEPIKSLGVRTFAPNCAEPGFAAMAVTIDDVRVNLP